jgi:hypothetical protein
MDRPEVAPLSLVLLLGIHGRGGTVCVRRADPVTALAFAVALPLREENLIGELGAGRRKVTRYSDARRGAKPGSAPLELTRPSAPKDRRRSATGLSSR